MTESTLTHILPLVNKTYYSYYSKSDVLWKSALFRLVKKQPKLWGRGLKAFLQEHSDDGYHVRIGNGDAGINGRNLNKKNCDDYEDDHNTYAVLDYAGRCMEHILSTATMNTTESPVYMELYRFILSNYIKFTSPLFYMPDDIQLGQEFGIHFFEPRYRLLISEVMAPYPDHYRNGEPITPNRNNSNDNDDNDTDDEDVDEFSYPTFIYAHKSPLKTGSSVVLVEVRQCVIHHNQTADVFLMPKTLARIEHVWERRNSHSLYEARVVKMSQEECDREMERSRMPSWQMQLQQQSGGGGSIGGDNNNNNGQYDYNQHHGNHSVAAVSVMDLWMMMQEHRQRENR